MNLIPLNVTGSFYSFINYSIKDAFNSSLTIKQMCLILLIITNSLEAFVKESDYTGCDIFFGFT